MITSRQHKSNPHPFYARLRAESPVHRVPLPGKQTAWLVVRYDDVVSVLKDKRFAKDHFRALTPGQIARRPWVPSFFQPLTRNMLDVDEPDHGRLRALVSKAFTPALVAQMQGRIQALTDELLEAACRRKRFDLISDYAQPIPTTIIAEMLGVPAEDHGKFTRWTRTVVTADSSAWGEVLAIPSMWCFLRYIRKLVRLRRAEPRDDLVTALVQAEEAGEQLDEGELMAMIFLLLVAGHETTVNLIGNGVLALIQHPDQLQRLRDDPALIAPAVEELLRYDGPLEVATERFASEDITVAGVTIPQGSLVHASLASANRDDRQFEDPDTVDITREPNNHVAFGLGSHYCLGAPLARMESQIAINTLLRRARHLHLAKGFSALRWRKGLVLRGLEAMPMKVCWRRKTPSA